MKIILKKIGKRQAQRNQYMQPELLQFGIQAFIDGQSEKEGESSQLNR